LKFGTRHLATYSIYIRAIIRQFELWRGRLTGCASPRVVSTVPCRYRAQEMALSLAHLQGIRELCMLLQGLLTAFILLQAAKIAQCASGDLIKTWFSNAP